MSDSKPRLFSPAADDAAVFHKRLQSLPPDEQEVFRSYQHSCQDKGFTGFVAARCCAQALHGEIRHNREVKRVEPALDPEGFVLSVVVSSDVWKWERFYRGYKVYQKIEYERP